MTPEILNQYESEIGTFAPMTEGQRFREVIAYVRELEKDKARIDKMGAHLESVMGSHWDGICMEWDDCGVMFTACMNSHPNKVDDLREAIDNAKE